MQGRSLKVFPQAILNFSDLQMEGNWWENFDLTKLDFSNNQITSIPEEISSQTVSNFCLDFAKDDFLYKHEFKFAQANS